MLTLEAVLYLSFFLLGISSLLLTVLGVIRPGVVGECLKDFAVLLWGREHKGTFFTDFCLLLGGLLCAMDPSATLDVPVTLVIRAPNQKYDDQTINCFLNWTVEQLKTHLSKVYPSKPLSRDQRLVYSGRLLLDHLQLKDVFRKQDDYHMVHLVCTSQSPPASPKATSTKCSSVMQDSSGSLGSGSDQATSSSSQDTLTTSVNSNSEGPRHRNVPHGQTNAVYSHAFPHVM